jgi:hypothetical protein
MSKQETFDEIMNRVANFIFDHAKDYVYVNKVTGEAEIMDFDFFDHMYKAIKQEA